MTSELQTHATVDLLLSREENLIFENVLKISGNFKSRESRLETHWPENRGEFHPHSAASIEPAHRRSAEG